VNTVPALYLIGCGSADQQTLQDATASADSMGFKAWNLLRMARINLPVPPAFVLGTAWCQDAASRASAALPATWTGGLQALQTACGLVLGDTRRPLLLSVRSGAPVSMPGMMETLLNIGLCDATLPGFVRQTGNPRLAWDAYRRLVASYGEVVAGIAPAHFDQDTTALVGERNERELDFSELRELTRRHLTTYAQHAGQPFPQDPVRQLSDAIGAVLGSWQSAKAIAYRQMNQLADTLGTAVTMQAMVFGNAGGRSGAGVGFTRDPATGEPVLWVDFLLNAQGEDVVSGRRSAQGHEDLSTVLPAAWQALQAAAHELEQHFGDMQDFEFTVQDGVLHMLQTRTGKRTPLAAARIALDLMDEGLIGADEARKRTAGLGVATGEIALDETRAQARHAAGVSVILVRRDAETSDIAALEAAQGLLTQRGARTSHAAVVARQLGKVCLVGCEAMQLDEAARTLQFGERVLHEGDVLTLDGNEGCVYAGAVRTVTEEPVALLARLATLAPAKASNKPQKPA